MQPIHKIEDEALQADEKYGDFASMHEALGVLEEEVYELRMAIFMKQSNERREWEIDREATQVAAVALRILQQCHKVKR